MEQTRDNSDKNTDDNNSESKKKVRRNKKQLFVVERKAIIDKLSKIIKLEENNNVVVYDDLVENMELKEYIIENIENIKKYYSCSGWGYFTNHLHGILDKNEITLMKSIYKDEGYKIISRQKTLLRNNTKKQCLELYFIK